MTEISQRYGALAAEFTRRVEAVGEDRWENPSPCAGWTARDVLRHVRDIHRTAPGYAGLEFTLTRSVEDDPCGAWAEARDAMQALLEDQDRANSEFDGVFGRTTVQDTVDRFVCFDLLIHGWDIARATGQDETLPPHEVSRVHADAVSFGDGLRLEGVCGPAVSVPDDSPEQDQLLALLGRRP